MSAPVILLSLGIDTFGYREFGGLPWVGSILNDSMILTGMGPLLAQFLRRVVHSMHATNQQAAENLQKSPN